MQTSFAAASTRDRIQDGATFYAKITADLQRFYLRTVQALEGYLTLDIKLSCEFAYRA